MLSEHTMAVTIIQGSITMISYNYTVSYKLNNNTSNISITITSLQKDQLQITSLQKDQLQPQHLQKSIIMLHKGSAEIFNRHRINYYIVL